MYHTILYIMVNPSQMQKCNEILVDNYLWMAKGKEYWCVINVPVKFIKAAPCSTWCQSFQKFSKGTVVKVFTAVETNTLKQNQAISSCLYQNYCKTITLMIPKKYNKKIEWCTCLATALAKSLTVSVFPVAVSPETRPP